MELEVLKNLVEQNMSISDISEATGFSKTNVRYWLKKYNIKTQHNKYNTGSKSDYKCPCGETDPVKFYGNKTKKCGKCHNEYTIEKGIERKAYARQKLGGKCASCEFDKYPESLDIHHLDPSIKDENFACMRGWSYKRIDKEISSCVLLCKNCHTAFHCGHDIKW